VASHSNSRFFLLITAAAGTRLALYLDGEAFGYLMRVLVTTANF
jgi:hypothetical protein